MYMFTLAAERPSSAWIKLSIVVSAKGAWTEARTIAAAEGVALGRDLSCPCRCQSSYIFSYYPILKYLQWLKINERINYKLLSLTYKVHTTTEPSYLYTLISVQPPRNTRFSSSVTISRPSSSS